MSRKLARSDADGLGGRAQRWLLDHLSRPDEARTPWRVDEMFEPEWRPRYFVYDGRGHFPSAAMAMARAESQRPFPSVGHAAAPPAGTGTGAGSDNGTGHGGNGHRRGARRAARDAATEQDAATNGERRTGWKASSTG